MTGIPLTSPTGETKRPALTLPGNSALLIVDEYGAWLTGGSKTLWYQDKSYHPMIKLAGIFDVPLAAYFVVRQPQPGHVNADQHFGDIVPVFSPSLQPWRETAFVERIEALNRPVLLVTGFCTTGSITFTVLEGLARGFDIGYIVDGSELVESTEAGLAIHRMVQAGAIPLSWRQLALEWQTDWSNDATREAVLSLIDA